MHCSVILPVKGTRLQNPVFFHGVCCRLSCSCLILMLCAYFILEWNLLPRSHTSVIGLNLCDACCGSYCVYVMYEMRIVTTTCQYAGQQREFGGEGVEFMHSCVCVCVCVCV